MVCFGTICFSDKYFKVIRIAHTLVVSSPTPGALMQPSSTTTGISVSSGKTVSVCAIKICTGASKSHSRLADASGLPEASIPNWMQQLEEFYQQAGSSLTVQKLGESWQLCTREQYANYIRLALVTKKAAPLSNAAMEALTIVAYNQPVTKSFVEHVRGIDSSSMINSLVEKGLLEEAGRLEIPGRPIAYRTTEVFLRSFGLSTLEELPPLPVQSLAEQPQTETESESE